MVIRIIEARAQNLTCTLLPAASRLDVLARTHALLLYQIICLFDGDIHARAAAEAAIPALEAAAVTLLDHVTFEDPSDERSVTVADPLCLSQPGATREFWEDWVFQESARRTVLITFHMLQLYRLLSGQRPMRCDSKPYMYMCYPWTLSAHLWHARDSVDFALAWKKKRHFVVSYSK